MRSKEICKVYYGGDLSYKHIIVHFLSEKFCLEEVDNIQKSDLVYWVYGKGPTLNIKNLWFWVISRKKFILHWIGTDVLNHINKLKVKKTKSRIYHSLWNLLIKRKISNKSMINFSSAPWLCEELLTVGIQSFYLPLTTIRNTTIENIQVEKRYDFMTYLPQKRMDLYSGYIVLKLAKDLPLSRFLIIVPDIKNMDELIIRYEGSNVVFMPSVEFQKIKHYYRESRCFLRFTQHDGLSLSVMEALENRMHVFWTYKFPFTNFVNLYDYNQLLTQVRDLVSAWEPNFYGQEYVIKELNIDNITNKFINYFEKFYAANSRL